MLIAEINNQMKVSRNTDEKAPDLWLKLKANMIVVCKHVRFGTWDCPKIICLITGKMKKYLYVSVSGPDQIYNLRQLFLEPKTPRVEVGQGNLIH